MADTSLRGFNPVGNTTLVPVQCKRCGNVARVFGRNTSWLCPSCGATYQDIDKYRVDKPTYRRGLEIINKFSLKRLQYELWGLPEMEAIVRSNKIVEEIKKGRVL